MPNRINPWQELLDLANKDIAPEGFKISVYSDKEECFWFVDIDEDGQPTYNFAENYYEDELSELINEAWALVRAKIRNGKKSD